MDSFGKHPICRSLGGTANHKDSDDKPMHVTKISKVLLNPEVGLGDYETLDIDARIRAEFHRNKEY